MPGSGKRHDVKSACDIASWRRAATGALPVTLCALMVCGAAHAQSVASDSIDWNVSLDRQSGYSSPFTAGAGSAKTRSLPLDPDGTRYLTVRQTDVWTAPTSSTHRPFAWLDDEETDVTYRRDWQGAQSRTAGGLDVSVTPHTALAIGRDGTSAVAGATLRLGRLAPDGDKVFGNRPRWYVFVAGSRRSYGLNLQRTPEGRMSNAGLSRERGGTYGDASIGIAYRRGPIESSIGLIYRENEPEGLRESSGIRTEVDEGILAFQLSIRPR